MPCDYYEVLGVTPAADHELIAKAYRLQARRHHPDHGGERSRFEQVEEAYQTLSDVKRRLSYDRMVLTTNGGTYCGGLDIYQVLPLRFEQAARGGRINVMRLGPAPRSVEVVVPSAVCDGERLRIFGRGLPARGSNAAGDLVLIISIEPHPRLRREGLDLVTDVQVPLDTAVHGGQVTVQGLDATHTVALAPQTSSGQRLRVRAAGLRTADGRYGDLYAVVQIVLPPGRAARAPAAGLDDSPHAQLAERLQDLGVERQRLEQRAAEINAQSDSLKQEQESLAARRTSLDEERVLLLRRAVEIEKRRETIEEREAQARVAHEEIAAIRLQLDQRAAQFAEAEGELARQRQCLPEAAQVKQFRRQLMEERAKFVRESQELDHSRSELQRQARALEAEQRSVEEAKLSLEQWRKAGTESQAAISAERAQLEARERRLNEREGRLESEARKLEADGEALAQERRAVQEQLEETSHEQNKLVAERQEFEKARTEFESLRESMAAEARELEARRSSVEADSRKLESERAAFAQEQQDLQRQSDEEVSRRREAIDAERDKLAAEWQEIQKARAEVDALRESLSTEARDLETRRSALEADSGTLDAQRMQLEQRTAEIEEREQKLKQPAPDRKSRAEAVRQIEASAKLPAVKLVLLDGGGHIHTCELARREVIIGRQPPADLRIHLPTVSRMHCRVEIWPGGVWAEDLGSRNGTLRNGQKITRDRLEPGNVLSVGEAHFVVVIDDKPADIRPPASGAVGAKTLDHDAAIRTHASCPTMPRPRPRAESPAVLAAGETQAGHPAFADQPSAGHRRPNVTVASPAQISAARFELVSAGHKPVFELSPNHVRCASGYIDRTGTRHLFVDFIDGSARTSHTWSAQVRYYRCGPQSTGWELACTIAGGGEDALYGAASPHVLCAGGQILVVYAARSMPSPGQRANPAAAPGQPGYLCSSIMLATAPMDEHGAPAGPFENHGPIIEPGLAWDAMRLDYPCAALDGEHVHVFYTAYDMATDLSHRVVGCATGTLGDWQFAKHAAPILAVEGGGQMPRVFRHRGLWHMFYHHFRRGEGARWRHYIATDPIYWREYDPNLFDPPQQDAGELMLWTDPAGRLTREPHAWLSAKVSGVAQLIEYKVEIRS